jgi:hypothetical protein
MSRGGIDQKKRRMIVVVLALLVVVATINVRTFLTDEAKPVHRPATSAADAAEVPLPFDLEEAAQKATVQLAAMRAGGGVELDRMLGGDREHTGRQFAGLRDPFRPDGAGKDSQRLSSSTRTTRSTDGTAAAGQATMAATRRDGLACTAVMLGVGEPLACIGDRYLSVGDEVRGYRVMRIDRTGALLKKDDKELFLPVGTQVDEKIYHRPVTGTGSGAPGR